MICKFVVLQHADPGGFGCTNESRSDVLYGIRVDTSYALPGVPGNVGVHLICPMR